MYTCMACSVVGFQTKNVCLMFGIKLMEIMECNRSFNTKKHVKLKYSFLLNILRNLLDKN